MPTSSSTPSPSPTATPSATPTVTPTATPLPVLCEDPEEFQVRTNADVLLGSNTAAKEAELNRLRGEISILFQSSEDQGQLAGIVLTFGTSSEVIEGNVLASEVSQLLAEVHPEVFGDAVLRLFHFIDSDAADRGIVTIEVFFFC
jgi:hypothetical protein